MALMRDGVRFGGLDELVTKLDEVEAAWRADPDLSRIAFLVSRARGDFETAIEAGLGGYPSVAADAMRDVMEIELLLLDFYVDRRQVDAWFAASRARRLREFSPAALRRRLIAIGLHDVIGTSHVELDYRAHSEALHVTPGEPLFPFLRKGFVDASDVASLDLSFIEIFEHGRRLGSALLLAANQIAPDSDAAEATGGRLPAFELAYERTQEIIQQFMALLRNTGAALDDEDEQG